MPTRNARRPLAGSGFRFADFRRPTVAGVGVEERQSGRPGSRPRTRAFPAVMSVAQASQILSLSDETSLWLHPPEGACRLWALAPTKRGLPCAPYAILAEELVDFSPSASVAGVGRRNPLQPRPSPRKRETRGTGAAGPRQTKGKLVTPRSPRLMATPGTHPR